MKPQHTSGSDSPIPQKKETRHCVQCGRPLNSYNRTDRCHCHAAVIYPDFGGHGECGGAFPGALCSEALGAPRPVNSSKLGNR